MFITKMGTIIPQDLIDYGNARKVTCGGDHYFSSDSWVGPFTTEGDRTWTSKPYRCGDVGVSTSRNSPFIRSWSSSSRLCRSTFQPEGQRVTRLGMHRARLAIVPGRPWLQPGERLKRVLINPAQCPLRSESDRIAAGQRNDAMCQQRTFPLSGAQRALRDDVDHLERHHYFAGLNDYLDERGARAAIRF